MISNKRKTNIFILSITILVLLFNISVFSLDTETKFTVTGGIVTDGKVTVEVDITGIPLSENAKTTMIDFIFDFGELSQYIQYPERSETNYRVFESGIELTSFEGYLLDGVKNAPPTGIFINNANTGSGKIKLELSVSDEVPGGSYPVTVKSSGDPDWLNNGREDSWFIAYNYDEDEDTADSFVYEATVIPGTITVGSSSDNNIAYTATYTASLQNPSATEIAAGGTFTADVYMAASDGKLAGGQLELDCVGGTITNIALADGLTNGEQSDLSKISFYGNTGDATNGIKVATVTVSTAETASGTVVLSIKDGGKAAVSGSYNDKDVTLEDATKSVTVNIKEKDQFSCSAYADASGKYLVQYTGTVGDGNVVKYTSGSTVTDLYYSEKYGAWVFLADSDLSSTLANANFSVVSGDKTSATIKYDGDVNKNGTTNIVDAQIAYDLTNNVYPTFEALPMEMWLSADVNRVIGVAAGDARAIQCIIHGIQDDSVSA
jgi:hypothetical protein